MTDFDKWLEEQAREITMPFIRSMISRTEAHKACIKMGRAAKEWILNDPSYSERSLLYCRIQTYQQEIGRLRETLEFYADPEHWTLPYVEGSLGDYGNIARQALSEHKQAMEGE